MMDKLHRFLDRYYFRIKGSSQQTNPFTFIEVSCSELLIAVCLNSPFWENKHNK